MIACMRTVGVQFNLMLPAGSATRAEWLAHEAMEACLSRLHTEDRKITAFEMGTAQAWENPGADGVFNVLVKGRVRTRSRHNKTALGLASECLWEGMRRLCDRHDPKWILHEGNYKIIEEAVQPPVAQAAVAPAP